MAEFWDDWGTTILNAVTPLIVFLIVFLVVFQFSNRRYKANYKTQMLRIDDSIELQKRAVALQEQTIALLGDIREILKGKP